MKKLLGNTKFIILSLLIGILLFSGIDIAAAANTFTIDFSSYPAGTSADAINEPGVTFTITQGTAKTTGTKLRLNYDTNFDPTAVTISLDEDAKSIIFPYNSYGNCGYPVNTIQLYHNGVMVDNTTVNSCVSGTYNVSVVFDEVRLYADRVTNIEGFEVSNIVIELNNQAPVCSDASPSQGILWSPNHKYNEIEILGVVDPDGDAVTINIDSILQDEAVNGTGDGKTAPDGLGVGTSTASVLAERDGGGNGRVYHIGFTADDGNGGTCSGEVLVSVPHDKKSEAIDDGPLYDSTTY